MIAATAGVGSGDVWWRLYASVALMVIGASGMYVVVVVLPAVQAEFGVARADASLPYTLTMIGVGLGGVLMGRLADRFGILLPLIAGIVCLAGGFVLAGLSESLSGFVIAHGVLIGLFGTSVTFAPLVADTSLWFERRRGVAVGICAAGNYVGGWLWPLWAASSPVPQGAHQTASTQGVYRAPVTEKPRTNSRLLCCFGRGGRDSKTDQPAHPCGSGWRAGGGFAGLRGRRWCGRWRVAEGSGSCV